MRVGVGLHIGNVQTLVQEVHSHGQLNLHLLVMISSLLVPFWFFFMYCMFDSCRELCGPIVDFIVFTFAF